MIRGVSRWMPWLALAGSLAVTGVASFQFRESALQAQQARFDQFAEAVHTRMLERLDDYGLVLKAGRSLFDSSESVTRAEWAAFVASLDLARTRPGVQGLGYAVWLPEGQARAHEEAVRREGFPDFAIHPPGRREEMTSILYIEPFRDRNLRAFGFDMWSEPTRRAALAQARDEGITTLSGRVTLVQETQRDVQSGFLIFVPVYKSHGVPPTLEARRRDLKGWVYSPFRMNDFMAGLLPPDLGPGSVEVREGSGGGAEAPMFRGPGAEAGHVSRLVQTRILRLHGATWQVRIASTPAFERSLDLRQMGLTLGLGGAVSGLLFLILWFLVRASGRVQALAEEMTQALREEQDYVRLLMDSSAEGIFGMDADGRCTFANAAAARLLGFDRPEELLGQPMHRTCHHTQQDGSPFPEADCPHSQVFATGVGVRLEGDLFWRRDGSSFWVDCSSYPILKGGRIEGVVVTFLDVSSKREHDRLKHEFVSVVSHELRTPLTSIRATIGMLRGAFGDTVPPESRNLLDIAHRNCERLVTLINDILDLEKIRSGRLKLNLGPVALGALLMEALESNRAFADQFRTTFHLEPPFAETLVNGDADRLLQVLGNLLSNAAKYGHEGGLVKVRAFPVGRFMRVEVEDQGPGIPPEFQGRIFQPFSQAESPETRKRGGSGLGLTIARSLVEGMGGELTYRTEPGRGTTFSFTLPLFDPSMF